jgi:hypothetical protein
MTTPLIWLHGDCLDPHGPALEAYPDAHAVFVFDDALLAEYQLSFKRIVFLYECLLEIPRAEIRKGDVPTQLALASAAHGCTRIATTESVAPRFRAIASALRTTHNLPVEIIPLVPFIELARGERLDLKRFSRYWSAVSRRAMEG